MLADQMKDFVGVDAYAQSNPTAGGAPLGQDKYEQATS